MTLNKDKWIVAYQKAVKDMRAEGKPTSGTVCAVATLRYLRDGLCDDIGDKNEDAKAQCETIRDCFKEIIKQVQEEKDYGFACNASAAAKVAGFKASNEFAGLVE